MAALRSALTYDGILKFATKITLYQPRSAINATFLANLMQADFAEGSNAIAISDLSPFLAKPLA